MKQLFFFMLALAFVWRGDVAEAAPSQSKVDWTGESFLDVTYKQVGKRQIKMDIYMPPAGKPDKAPVLYYVHGGGTVLCRRKQARGCTE